MSKTSKRVKNIKSNAEARYGEAHINFMGGVNYTINPLETLKMITASSIFGEPSYYRDSDTSEKYIVSKYIGKHSVLPDYLGGLTTEQVMESAIDAALDYDFAATLEWAQELRFKYNMRLNPQVIMVRAALHPKRAGFTAANPARFDEINQKIMSRADEPMSQMAYYLCRNGGKKNNVPSILKRGWAKKLGGLDAYGVAKYKNHEIGMVDAVRICHATSPVIDELMKTGTVAVDEDKKTWENLRSQGTGWKDIFHTVNMGHMALLRNLRGVFTEVEDAAFCKEYLAKLKSGVKSGKQFPFRYYAAYKVISESECNHRPAILNALEECMDISLENCPRLDGKTMCLSDNSGSAWNSFPSEYGKVYIAEIDNLSAVIAAALSDEGYVGKFGDRLEVTPVTKRSGILAQAQKLSEDHGDGVGGATEGGIWEFFQSAIQNNEYWDNIFIYSDQQAGHGGLYGTDDQHKIYAKKYGCRGKNSDLYDMDVSDESMYINVFKLILEYRKKVNPKVNVFSIQTAGYSDAVIPEYAYRTSILYGWTGRETEFAKILTEQWNALDSENKA